MVSGPNNRMFEEFTVDDWIDWIRHVINYETCHPTINYTIQEIHHSLAEVYTSLPPGALSEKFAEALTFVFEETPLIAKHSANLYHLLQLIGYVKPLRAKRVLRKHLFPEVLKSLNYGNQNLHTMLLATRSKYDVDDELAEYVKRSAQNSRDFSYQIVCLRVIASRSQDELLDLLEIVYKSTDTDIKAYQLARELRSLTRKYGFKYFCEWFTTKAELSASVGTFEKALREIVFSRFKLPTFDGKQSLSTLVLNNDPYEMLLGAQLLATSTRLNPKQIAAVALTHKQVENINLIIQTLINIWKRRSDKDHQEQPWFFISGSPYVNRKLVIVSSGAVPNASVTFEFLSDEDPVLTSVLEKVKNECEIQIPFKFQAFA
jgi:hypothetical protein